MRTEISQIRPDPRTQRSGVSGRPKNPLTPLRCVRGSDDVSIRRDATRLTERLPKPYSPARA
jgi:hypothetical protein